MSEPKEEEAWTEEYFAKQDCGTVVGEPPTYQWVVMRYNSEEEKEPIYTFCKEGYAKLYVKWMLQIDPLAEFEINKVINNPPKPKELIK
jgi:hypothetical protein